MYFIASSCKEVKTFSDSAGRPKVDHQYKTEVHMEILCTCCSTVEFMYLCGFEWKLLWFNLASKHLHLVSRIWVQGVIICLVDQFLLVLYPCINVCIYKQCFWPHFNAVCLYLFTMITCANSKHTVLCNKFLNITHICKDLGRIFFFFKFR